MIYYQLVIANQMDALPNIYYFTKGFKANYGDSKIKTLYSGGYVRLRAA